MKYSNVLANNTLSTSDHLSNGSTSSNESISSNGSIFSNESIFLNEPISSNRSSSNRSSNGKMICQTKNDCTKLFAHSFCNYKTCHCNFGYKFKFIGCLKMCQIDGDCYNDDPNRMCVNRLCHCKDGFKQIAKSKLCVKELSKENKMNTMLICLLVGISPLAIVVIAICFKVSSFPLTNGQTEKISSNNFQLHKYNNQNHQNISINSPPNHCDAESGSTSSFEYESADSLKSHKI